MNIPVVPGKTPRCSKDQMPLVETKRSAKNRVLICTLCDYTPDGAGPPADAFLPQETQ